MQNATTTRHDIAREDMTTMVAQGHLTASRSTMVPLEMTGRNVIIIAHATNLRDNFTAQVPRTMAVRMDTVRIHDQVIQAIVLHAVMSAATLTLERFPVTMDMTVTDVGWAIAV